MPLFQTAHRRECPLGKFEISLEGGAGSYTADPVEACFSCIFADLNITKFDLEKICQCPPNMTLKEFYKLKKGYKENGGNLTREGFWVYVQENFVKKAES